MKILKNYIKLKIFQKQNKMIELEYQALAGIQVASEIKAKLHFAEVKYGIAQSLLNSNSYEIVLLEKEINELKKQIVSLEIGSESDYFPSFSMIPDLAFQLAQLKREVLIQNTFTILLIQFE